MKTTATITAPFTFESNPKTAQLTVLLQNLCKAKTDIDAFFEAQTEGVLDDIKDRYLDAEGHLCEAIGKLGEYFGMIAVDIFLTRDEYKTL
jgi:hypothetical protein